MNILWYNTFTLPIISTKQHLCKLNDELVKIIKQYKIDIIMLCEVFLKADAEELLKNLIEDLNEDWSIICQPKKEKKDFYKISSGLIVLIKNKYKSLSTNFTPYQSSNFPDSISNKGYWEIKLKDLFLICTHLQHRETIFFRERSVQKHIIQQQELLNSIKNNIKDKPFVLIGDINCTPEKLIKNDYKITSPNEATTTEGEILDYVMSSHNIDIKVNVINDFQPYISDHYPILIHISNM
jgi:endonuclease/exonuclease/phosphatase family metal-dependent hydrolase